MAGASRIAGSKMAWRPTMPFSGSRKALLVASMSSAVTGSGRLDAPHGRARHDDVVAGLEGEMPVVAKEGAGAPVDEQQLVAVGVARQVVHRPVRVP